MPARLSSSDMADPQASTGKNHFEILKAWCIRHPYWTLALSTIGALAPFLTKPFNIDDPLYVWAAQHIWVNPAAPYAFNVNWNGFSQPMWEAMQNPPLMSYYLALAAGIFGWSEIGLHFACLLPAVAVVLGTYRLAKLLCSRPMLAALATLFAPGCFVSSTTVMCDVSMLALWIWAVVFWVEGIKSNNLGKLLWAGIFIALALLTKFNSLCLLPLLAAYGWIEKRTIGRWAFCLLMPLAALGAYEWLTLHFYGEPHFIASCKYAHHLQTFQGMARYFKTLNALTFTGGCFACAFFCAPMLWSRQTLLWFTVTGVLLTSVAIIGGMIAKHLYWITGASLFSLEMQTILWSVGGVCVLALSINDVWQKRDPDSWLLALWILGTFAFAAFIYWLVNARAILPMAPAVAILIVRRWEKTGLPMGTGMKLSFVAGAVLSLLTAQADFQLAITARKGAEEACAKFANISDRLWFQGHWGFQYYMQKGGARPVDFDSPGLVPGDILIDPGLNSGGLRLDKKSLISRGFFSMPDFPWLATLNASVGAGFYSQRAGPVPFVFGFILPEDFFVYASAGN